MIATLFLLLMQSAGSGALSGSTAVTFTPIGTLANGASLVGNIDITFGVAGTLIEASDVTDLWTIQSRRIGAVFGTP